MTDYAYPIYVSERHGPSPWTHCVACSGLMALNALNPAKSPPMTYAEADRIYQHAHPYPSGGESVENVVRAMQSLYGLGSVPIIGSDEGFRPVWDALDPGKAALLIVQPNALPETSILRKWVGLKFAGLHGVYVQRRDSRAAVWLIDPMGPDTGTYRGNLLQQADLAKAYRGSAAIFGMAKA